MDKPDSVSGRDVHMTAGHVRVRPYVWILEQFHLSSFYQPSIRTRQQFVTYSRLQ